MIGEGVSSSIADCWAVVVDYREAHADCDVARIHLCWWVGGSCEEVVGWEDCVKGVVGHACLARVEGYVLGAFLGNASVEWGDWVFGFEIGMDRDDGW